ncbi:MAG: hypothetical protein JWO20_889 [Candidatus Angelobacter sp.]|jgi:hypothetical protein|nr:hypothetical protein [Candidatus Angelobacter sp.]
MMNLKRRAEESPCPRIIFALAILAILSIEGCQRKPAEASTSSKEQEKTIQNPVAVTIASAPRILTKNPDYARFLEPPQGDDFLKDYSFGYRDKVAEIETRASSVGDESLRQQALRDEWSKVDKEKFRGEASKAFEVAKQQFLSAHREDWFEVGHFEYDQTEKSLKVKTIAAAPLQVEFDVPLDLATMDAIYGKFHLIVDNRINTRIENEVDDYIRQVRPPYPRWQVLQSAHEQDYKSYERSFRTEQLVVAAQGDLPSKRIDRLFLVDYETETILFELDPKALSKSSHYWKF